MKIALPVNEKNEKTEICPSFGRTPYYMIYDTETKRTEFIENAAAYSAGGAGIKAAQTLLDNKVEAVIAPRCGENAEKVLCDAGVSVFKNIDGNAMKNVKAFENKKLTALAEIHAGFHGNGGK